MLLSREVRDTQPNPRYSAKNNDAIRMIASFMPIFLSISAYSDYFTPLPVKLFEL